VGVLVEVFSSEEVVAADCGAGTYSVLVISFAKITSIWK
jgi:hypothetical protein